MSQPKIVTTIDYHTGGEPFRIVTGGVPPLEGRSILDKRRYAKEHHDDVRQMLVYEPRGHADMYGCFVTAPADETGDLGVVFFHNEGYSTACGHGTIALVTWALESGRLPAVDGDRPTVLVDAPSGRLTTTATMDGARVASVRFTNVPSFVWDTGVKVNTTGGPVTCDVSFGGAFYASVAAGDVGLTVSKDDLPRLIELGREIKKAIEGAHDVVHPEEPELNGVYGVIFFEDAPGDGGLGQRNVTIFADGEVDRSPCGSGTSARLALLDASGELQRGETLRHESIVGSVFTSRVSGDARAGGTPAVITEVEGSAYRTGAHEFYLDPADELGTGFLLR
jgi:proline racemase